MRNMTTKKELTAWLRANAAQDNSVWVMINGGGASLLSPDEIEGLIEQIERDDYNEPVILEKGAEYKDFRQVMYRDEYEGTDRFIFVEHINDYNEANNDIQIQNWD